MADPEVTVLVATRDRVESLGPSLDTVLASADLAPFATEVLVVDNGSTDGTDRLLEDRGRTWPILRIRTDPEAGRSGALNRTLPEVRGKVIVFTDDDVHVPPGWVTDMARPILSGAADVVCGLVELASDLDRPWLTPELRKSLAEVTDVSGRSPGFVGANMATSSEAARAIGFDEELGAGGPLGMSEDLLFNLRLKAAGYRLVGCTGTPVVHHPLADRLTYEPMRQLARRNGASNAYIWHHWLHAELGMLPVRRLRARVRLWWTRMVTPAEPGGITEREYKRWYDVSFVERMAVERGRPPRYDSAAAAAPGRSPRPN